MFTALLLLFAIFVQTQGRQPGCPNNQEPKRNPDGTLVQCLPGAAQRTICGVSHLCYFSGMNYMCCPSNEPSAENQPTCPKSTMTVIDSHGFPLKCSPRTRQCPSASMFCTDVGLAFICCEKPQIQEIKHDQEVKAPKKTTKKLIKRKKTKTITTPAPEEENECPTGSIGVLNHYGLPLKCSATTKCSGFARFCHGGPGGPICCEKIEFAQSILDAPSVKPENPSIKPAPVRVSLKPSAQKSVEGTIDIVNPLPISSGERLHKSPRRHRLQPVALSPLNTVDDSSAALRTLPYINEYTTTTTTTTTITTTTPPTTTEEQKAETEPLIVFTTAAPEVTTTKARAFAVKMRPLERETAIPLAESSRGKASELLNAQEKRTMAQKFLMHQIRNGWPYDDRFYRPDLDAFTNEQRSDIAQLRFIDN